MPVASSQLSLVYYDVPKVACTSLKTWFWELEMVKLLQVIARETECLIDWD